MPVRGTKRKAVGEAQKDRKPLHQRENLRLEWWEPGKLNAHPNNWRRHPKSQMLAMEDIVRKVGWAGAALYNERTGRLLDGHMRKDLTLGSRVPVIVGNWSERQEKIILATFDPVGDMADSSPAQIEKLLKNIDVDEPNIKRVLKRLEQETADAVADADREIADVEIEDDAPDELLNEDDIPVAEQELVEFRNDAIFSSTNKWGIPDLREDMLADLVPSEIWCGEKKIPDPSKWIFLFGKGRYTPEMVEGGVICFYIDDYRFETDIWEDAIDTARHLKSLNLGAVMGADFSMYTGDPLICSGHTFYKRQWATRLWQEMGMKVIPNISSVRGELLHEWDMAGIPRRAPVVAVQVRTYTKDEQTKLRKSFVRTLAESVEELRPKNLIIYGGREHRDWIAPRMPGHTRTRYHYLDSWTGKRRARAFKVGGRYELNKEEDAA